MTQIPIKIIGMALKISWFCEIRAATARPGHGGFAPDGGFAEPERYQSAQAVRWAGHHLQG